MLDSGDKSDKGRGAGVDVEMGWWSLFYYFTVQSYLLCVWEKLGSLYYFARFLIHSGSLQKMLTALFNLVWNTQENGQFFLE